MHWVGFFYDHLSGALLIDALLPWMRAVGSAEPLGKLQGRESGQLLFAAAAHLVCLGKVTPPLEGVMGRRARWRGDC